MYQYAKKILIVTAVMGLAGLGFASPVLADSGTSTSAVNQVFQSAKDALDNLLSAKDAGDVSDVTLRVSAFNQVLDLSTAEAKDFELKLLTVDKNADYNVWVKNSLDGLTNALVYYDSERQTLASSSPTLDDIKSMASDFKTWRDKNYVPLLNQLQDFFLVRQEFSAIGTSEKRLSNIQNDLSTLNFSSKNQKAINGMLDAASSDIKGAKDLNNQAYQLFLKSDVEPLTATSTEATSTEATSTEATLTETVATSTSSSTATSTDTAESTSTPQIVSIKGLVGESLSKIKDAYQNFIDISNLVRKLLQQ